jgi:hypothetical protein
MEEGLMDLHKSPVKEITTNGLMFELIVLDKKFVKVKDTRILDHIQEIEAELKQRGITFYEEPPDEPKKETVNHPFYYGGDTTYEVIKVLEAWFTPDEYIGFCKGNAIKYQARHRQKGGIEDLKKAKWYQDELMRFLGKQK